MVVKYMSNELIRLENCSKYFKDKCIFDSMNLIIEEGEFISISGSSGDGKTTLLHLLSLFDRPDKGNYYFKNELINNESSKKLSDIRLNNFGFVFQNYNLIPGLSSIENVSIPFHYLKSFSNEEQLKKIHDLFKTFNLEHVEQQKMETLSGGEKQRVAIIRSLVLNPKIIFADEPTGNLDTENRDIVLNLFKKINREEGIAIVLVSHDQQCSSIAAKQYKITDKKVALL